MKGNSVNIPTCTPLIKLNCATTNLNPLILIMSGGPSVGRTCIGWNDDDPYAQTAY